MKQFSFSEKNKMLLFFIILMIGGLLPFQNCSKVDFKPDSSLADVKIEGNDLNPTPTPAPSPTPKPPVTGCQKVSCDLTPLTDKPAVTTVLIALGDVSEDQLVVNGASSQLIAESVIRYSSPQGNPKVLLVVDQKASVEDPEDTDFVKDVLLKRYNVSVLMEPKEGINIRDLEGYDVVWFNNPGHPMTSINSRNALMQFKGAVILQGDDLSRGIDFSLEELTGLKYLNNGTSVVCDDGVAYAHDNNTGQQFRVSLDKSKVAGVDDSTINFRYGNDIDETEVVGKNMEVLAVAKGGPDTCTKTRPAIIRRTK